MDGLCDEKKDHEPSRPRHDFRHPVIDVHSGKPCLKSQSYANDKDTIQSAGPAELRAEGVMRRAI